MTKTEIVKYTRITPLLKNKLIDAAAQRMSPDEMGAKYGVNPAEALVAVRETLASRDVWSELEQRQLLLHDLIALKSQAQERFAGGDHKDGTLLLQTLRAVGDILEKQSKITQADIEKVSAAHGKVMLRLIVSAFDAARAVLESEYPEVDVQVVEEAFQRELSAAVAE